MSPPSLLFQKRLLYLCNEGRHTEMSFYPYMYTDMGCLGSTVIWLCTATAVAALLGLSAFETREAQTPRKDVLVPQKLPLVLLNRERVEVEVSGVMFVSARNKEEASLLQSMFPRPRWSVVAFETLCLDSIRLQAEAAVACHNKSLEAAHREQPLSAMKECSPCSRSWKDICLAN